MKFFPEGKRKLFYGCAAFLALCGGAVYLHAQFSEFRDGLFFWLGSMLAAHVTQEKLMQSNTQKAGTP